jgi:hypothetical protein
MIRLGHSNSSISNFLIVGNLNFDERSVFLDQYVILNDESAFLLHEQFYDIAIFIYTGSAQNCYDIDEE